MPGSGRKQHRLIRANLKLSRIAGLSMILICSFFNGVAGQDLQDDRIARLVFYNTENFFDPFDDSLTDDREFLPGGIRGWKWERYLEKENRIYKVLASVGEWSPPELIGLCEIENRFVLNRLTRKTPLMKYGYRIIHYESPDERGIDVALLYRQTVFQPLEHARFPAGSPANPTRDILYVKGTIIGRDTIHLIFCHWPSRWRGYTETIPDRVAAARVASRLVDSIRSRSPRRRIILAGDLNDELNDPAVAGILGIRTGFPLYDSLMYHTGFGPGSGSGSGSAFQGTIKYQGQWYEFDHIFASGFFLTDTCLFIKPGGKKVYRPDFLLEKDQDFPGKRPYRTYIGYRYHGGFSDHLPVFIDIYSTCPVK